MFLWPKLLKKKIETEKQQQQKQVKYTKVPGDI